MLKFYFYYSVAKYNYTEEYVSCNTSTRPKMNENWLKAFFKF